MLYLPLLIFLIILRIFKGKFYCLNHATAAAHIDNGNFAFNIFFEEVCREGIDA